MLTSTVEAKAADALDGVMAAMGAASGFGLRSGRFTEEAIAFAKSMVKRLARRGNNAGSEWGCTGYPGCKETQANR